MEPTGRAGRSRPRRGPGQRPAEVTPASQTAFQGPGQRPRLPGTGPSALQAGSSEHWTRWVAPRPGAQAGRWGGRVASGDPASPSGCGRWSRVPQAVMDARSSDHRPALPSPLLTACPRVSPQVPPARAGDWFLWHPPSRPGRTCPVALLTGELCIEGPCPLVGPVDPASALSCRPPEPQAPWEGTGLDPPAQAADRPRVPAPAPQSPAPSPRACCPCTLGKMA